MTDEKIRNWVIDYGITQEFNTEDAVNLISDFLADHAPAIEDIHELSDVRSKFNKFIREQKDIPSEYVDIINKNFWDLL